MTTDKRDFFLEGTSGLLIVLFVYAATSKWLDRTSFQAVLSQSPLIGSMAPLMASALPLSEWGIALLLIFPKTRYWGFWSALVLLLLFTLYLGYMLLFTPDLPCSCGGVLKQLSWPGHLLFNLFFVALCGRALQVRAHQQPGLTVKPFVQND